VKIAITEFAAGHHFGNPDGKGIELEYVHLTHEQLHIILRALDIFSTDMHSAATVTGSEEALREAEIADALMDELDSYLEGPEDE